MDAKYKFLIIKNQSYLIFLPIFMAKNGFEDIK